MEGLSTTHIRITKFKRSCIWEVSRFAQTPAHLAERHGRKQQGVAEWQHVKAPPISTLILEFRLYFGKFRWLGALMEHVSNHHHCNESANLCLLAPCWLMLNCLEMKWLQPVNPSLQNFTFTQIILEFFFYAHILQYITSSAQIPFPCTNTIYSV